MKVELEWKAGKPKGDGWYFTTYDGDICGEDGKRLVGMAELEGGEWSEGETVYAWADLPEPYMEDVIKKKNELVEALQTLESYASPNGIGFQEVKDAIKKVLPILKDQIEWETLCRQPTEATKNDINKRREENLQKIQDG